MAFRPVGLKEVKQSFFRHAAIQPWFGQKRRQKQSFYAVIATPKGSDIEPGKIKQLVS